MWLAVEAPHPKDNMRGSVSLCDGCRAVWEIQAAYAALTAMENGAPPNVRPNVRPLGHLRAALAASGQDAVDRLLREYGVSLPPPAGEPR